MGLPVRIYCDGAFGDSKGIIYMISYDADGKLLSAGRGEITEECKSVQAAQYLAVIQSLENGLSLFGLSNTPVEVFLNSRSMVKHFTGKWPVKKKPLLKYHQRAVAKIARYSNIRVFFSSKNIIGMVNDELERQAMRLKGETDGQDEKLD